MNIKNIKFSTLICIFFIVFSSVYLYQSFQYSYWHLYSPGAGFVPRWVSGLMLILSIICLVNSLKEEGIKVNEVFPKGVGMGNLIVAWVSLIFFTAVSKKLGLIITSSIMLSALFGRSIKLHKAIIYGTIVSLFCFVLFKIILKVPVPVNKFGW
jgi:putative tricarboxylic transport membrane protein